METAVLHFVYDIDEIRKRVFGGTLLMQYFIPGVTLTSLSLKIAEKEAMKKVQARLKTLSDKEIVFMRMMDKSNISWVFTDELAIRQSMKSKMRKIAEIMEHIENLEEVTEEEIGRISEKLQVEQRIVSHIEYLMNYNIHGLEIMDKREIRLKLREIVVQTQSLYNFISKVNDSIGPVTLVAKVMNNIPLDKKFIRFPIQLSPEEEEEIVFFISENKELNQEDLCYILASLYQLEEKTITYFIENT